MYLDLFKLKIVKDKKLISLILNSINFAFESSVLTEINSNQYHTIKYKIFNNYALIFDKFNGHINIFFIENINLHYTNEQSFQKYLSNIDYTQEELYCFYYFYKYDYGCSLVFQKNNSIKEKIVNFLSNQAKKILNTQHLFSNDPSHFKTLTDFLNIHSNLNYSFNDHNFMSTIKDSLHLYENSINEISNYLKNIILNQNIDESYCKNNTLKLWKNNNFVFITRSDDFQSLLYCIYFENETKFSIYCFPILSHEENFIFLECQEILMNIKEKIDNINHLNHTIVSIKDNDIKFINPYHYHYFYIFFKNI